MVPTSQVERARRRVGEASPSCSARVEKQLSLLGPSLAGSIWAVLGWFVWGVESASFAGPVLGLFGCGYFLYWCSRRLWGFGLPIAVGSS